VRAVEALRARGEPFSMSLTTLAGHPIEAQGRALGGHAVLRLKDAGGIKRELVELLERYENLAAETSALRAVVETLPSPVWTRNAAGRLTFVNAAYARAVEAKTAAEAVDRRLEFLDQAARESIAQARRAGRAYSGRLRAALGGAQRTFEVLDFDTPVLFQSKELGRVHLGLYEAPLKRVANLMLVLLAIRPPLLRLLLGCEDRRDPVQFAVWHAANA